MRRIIGTAARFGWLDKRQTELTVPRYNPEGRKIALEAAREGITVIEERLAICFRSTEPRRKQFWSVGPNAYPAVRGRRRVALPSSPLRRSVSLKD